MTSTDNACQSLDPPSYSGLACPYPLVLVRRVLSCLRHEGPAATLRQAGRFLGRRIRRRFGSQAPRQLPPVAVSHLRAGDLVEVKPEAEIRRTLDADRRHRGLAFLPGMSCYCGQRFRVHKRVSRIFLEESGQLRSLKDTVLLEGVYCDGAGLGCDRSCFYYWREAWLDRAPAGDESPR